MLVNMPVPACWPPLDGLPGEFHAIRAARNTGSKTPDSKAGEY